MKKNPDTIAAAAIELKIFRAADLARKLSEVQKVSRQLANAWWNGASISAKWLPSLSHLFGSDKARQIISTHRNTMREKRAKKTTLSALKVAAQFAEGKHDAAAAQSLQRLTKTLESDLAEPLHDSAQLEFDAFEHPVTAGAVHSY